MYKSLLDVVADAQSLDELTVLDDVVLLDVGEKTTTTADEHEQATTGVEVLLVGLHVLGQLLDALGQDGDLNLGVAGVDRGVTELGSQLRLDCDKLAFVYAESNIFKYINTGFGVSKTQIFDCICFHFIPSPIFTDSGINIKNV